MKLSIFKGAFKEYFRSKFPIFDPPPPPCLSVCFTCNPPPPPSPTRKRTFALVSYPPLKKSSAMFMNFRMKNREVMRENNKFFCKLNVKDQYFLHSYIAIRPH